MEAKFSQRVKDVLTYSREEAMRLGNDYIGLEHLLLGILREGEGMAVQIMLYFGLDFMESDRRQEVAGHSGEIGPGSVVEHVFPYRVDGRFRGIDFDRTVVFSVDVLGKKRK